MPWCERCDRFLNPNTVLADGTCPTCGRQVDRPTPVGSRSVNERPAEEGSGEHADHRGDAATMEQDEDFKAPWHFWVMIAAAVIYLGWRLLEGIWWVVQQVL